MSDRIRLLEDALTILHSSTGATEPHPLLDRDALKIKSIIELHAAISQGQGPERPQPEEETEDSQYIDAFGTLAIRDDGAATFYGRSAGQEVQSCHHLKIEFYSSLTAIFWSITEYSHCTFRSFSQATLLQI